MIKIEPAAWMPTATGLRFKFSNINENQLSIVDIAHATSFQCRYNGHTRVFYSVAEHCIRVADYLMKGTGDKQLALAGLLHDASEAYVGDIISPIKARYFDKSIEDQIDALIATQFGVPLDLLHSDIVKYADLVLLTTEMRDLFLHDVSAELGNICKKYPPLPDTINVMTPDHVREFYVMQFEWYKQ